MNPNELILKDIIPPQGVSIWPLAPGWWLLLALMVLLLALFFWYKGSMYHKQKRAKKQLFQHIEKELKQIRQQEDAHSSLQKVNQLLKLLLINLSAREEIAPLHNQDWVDYLESHAKPFQFSEHSRFLLTEGLYQKPEQINLAPLLQEIQSWLKQLGKNTS